MLPLQAGGGYTLVQTAFAVAVLLALFVFAATLKARNQFAGLDQSYREHLHAIRGHYLTTDPVTRRFDHERVRDGGVDVRAALHQLVDVAHEGQTDRQHTPVRVAVADAWADLTADLDRRVLALGRVALLILVFAPIALSTERIVRLLETEPGGLTLSAVLDGIQQGTAAAGDVLVSVATAFPFAGAVWALLVALVFTAGQLLWQHWYVLVAVLIGCAIVLYALEDSAAGPPRGVRSRRWQAARIAGVLAVVWAVGAVPAVLGRLVGFETVGAAVGVVFAAGVAGYGLYISGRRWVRGLRRTGFAREPAGQVTVAYRLARYVSLWTLVVAGPLAVLYAAVAVISGSLFDVLGALAAAHPLIQTGVLVAVLAIVAVVSLLLRDHWDEIRQALREASVRSRVRAGLWVSGMPTLVGIFAYIGLVGMLPLPIALLGAVVLVLLVRFGGRLVQRARYSESLLSDRAVRHDPLVEVWVATDADDRPQYLARVSGTGLAHADRDSFVAAVADAVREVAADGELSPCLEREYFQRLTEQGVTDPDDVDLDEVVRAKIFGLLTDDQRRKRAVDREWFDEQLADCPDDVVQRQLARHDDCIEATADVVELRHDPYRQQDRTRSGVRRPTA